ncbi:hypothetical protein EYF80_033038 [Liparis tanakae]|uniref:Uncharacterized protein n=1 Tax=Liparis tanakae TaxID=230148 RepID=A0A4Z2GU86_9TELE|nr:hypothetical protein EYF80_033038 [Liparis tanakae]
MKKKKKEKEKNKNKNKKKEKKNKKKKIKKKKKEKKMKKKEKKKTPPTHTHTHTHTHNIFLSRKYANKIIREEFASADAEAALPVKNRREESEWMFFSFFECNLSASQSGCARSLEPKEERGTTSPDPNGIRRALRRSR